MSTSSKPDSSERQQFGQTVEREPGTGRIVRVLADGRRVAVDPEEGPLTSYPTDPVKPKPAK
jgi:hypothetical protein